MLRFPVDPMKVTRREGASGGLAAGDLTRIADSIGVKIQIFPT